MSSLRNRAIGAGVIWACIFAACATYVLFRYVESQNLRNFDTQLRAQHIQLAVALFDSGGDLSLIAPKLIRPEYQRPESGSYWQVTRVGGETATSRSLLASLLSTSADPGPQVDITNMIGPSGERLRAARQTVKLQDGSSWVIYTAESIEPLLAARAELRQRLNVGILLTIGCASLGAFGLVLFALRPLAQLRKDVTQRWEDADDLPIAEYPKEIQPLVADISRLLMRNREIVSRSRTQAADLAHAIKTPSAIMRNELDALMAEGVEVTDAIQALDRLDGQLNRTFARMRATQGSSRERIRTDLSGSLDRMGRAFASLAKKRGRRLDVDVQSQLSVPVDHQDLEEVLGNLLDNALKWSKSQIALSAQLVEDHIDITVEDDGPGIPVSQRQNVVEALTRLDEDVAGTGLGLSIARDIIKAYDGTMEILDSGSLGGACIKVRLRATRDTLTSHAHT